MSKNNLDGWIEYYYSKIQYLIKPYIDKELQKHKLTKEQFMQIIYGVFERAVKELRG